MSAFIRIQDAAGTVLAEVPLRQISQRRHGDLERHVLRLCVGRPAATEVKIVRATEVETLTLDSGRIVGTSRVIRPREVRS